jgi:hypothetical protein
MHDPNAVISQPDDRATCEEQEREWEADERDRVALLEAWKTFRERHPNKQVKWSHELIEEERGATHEGFVVVNPLSSSAP